MSLTYRVLPSEEWPRLIHEGIEPFATHGLPDVDKWSGWRMIVAEEDGRIIALSCLRAEVLNDWYIRPDARRNPRLVHELWQQTRHVLDDEGIALLHVTVRDDQPEVQSMVERLGYQGAEGKVYALLVEQCLLNGV